MNQILTDREEYIQSISHKWAIGAISTEGFWFLKKLADWQFAMKLEDFGIYMDSDWSSYVL